VKSLKKIAVYAGILVLLALFAWALPTMAKDRPKGLTDRGPLTKITFIHYKKGYAKPPWAGGGKNESKCYGFLSKGAKWKNLEPYFMNPKNDDGMPASFVESAITEGVTEWETYGGNIFGAGSLSTGYGFNNGDLDYKNTTSFGSYPDDGVIAVANVWGYFYGPPSTRELVEWDMLFDDGDFDWSAEADGVAGKMDFLNIATHEIGHAAGMGHPSDGCTEETMYRFAGAGEIKKRDLNAGDVAGVKELYK